LINCRLFSSLLLSSLLLLPGGMLRAQPHFPEGDITGASISELQQQMTAGTLTAEALVSAHLARVAADEQQGMGLNALIRLNPDALAQARALDAERAISGPRSLLHGIPFVLKDNFNTADMPVTGASRALIDFQPQHNATQVQRLLDAGAIILAKSNLHEFAYGITSVSSLGGQTRNPFDPQRVPGGSSGGSAAAVAAGFASFGMGSDTCGSIRIPAAFNNLVGLRPSRGLSSTWGVMPLSSTQDVAGPLARSISDLAIILDLSVGHDPNDPVTDIMLNRRLPDFSAQLGSVSLNGLRVGMLETWMDAAEPAMREVLDRAMETLIDQGAELLPFALEDMDELLAASGVIGLEFETDLNAWLETFGSTDYPSLATIVASGLHHPAVHNVLTNSLRGERDEAAYQAALAARETLRDALEQSMLAHNIDVIIYPPSSSLPVRIGGAQPGNLCRLSAHSGLPALVLPVGFTDNGLPVGLELLAGHLQDSWLLALGYALEL